MDTQWFPHFLRKNYPKIEVTNEEAIEIGEEFKEYLQEVFKDEESKLNEIWDISPKKVIFNQDHPFKVNGYDPVLIIHFDLFVQKMKKQIQEES